MPDLIRYGIGRDYLPDWGIQEALREVYQNFMDWGEYIEEARVITEDHKICGMEREAVENFGGSAQEVRMTNDFNPSDLGFLKIGCSGKRDDSRAVGKHGEGLKMSAMVIVRAGGHFRFAFDNKMFMGVFYQDDLMGECFGFEVTGNSPVDGFTLEFTVPVEEFEKYRVKKIDPDDVIFENAFGQMIKRDPGTVYVGGHFVCVEDGLNHAYNFSPEFVQLDRDRSVPRAFDVDYAASRIVERSNEMSIEDLVGREGTYVERVPEKVAKAFEPELSGGGKVIFRTKDGGIQAPFKVGESLMKRPENKKKVKKLRYSMSKKRTPHTMLKEFFDRYHVHLPEMAKIDADNLVAKSKGWKKK